MSDRRYMDLTESLEGPGSVKWAYASAADGADEDFDVAEDALAEDAVAEDAVAEEVDAVEVADDDSSFGVPYALRAGQSDRGNA